MKKWQKVTLICLAAFIVASGIAALICVNHFVGFPKAVSDTKWDYAQKEILISHDGITLYGKALIPDGAGPFPTVIYAHGAESDHRSDMTTLKSLAMSGITVYTFDFYGWTDRSTGPDGSAWFKNSGQRNYEEQVLNQVKDLNAVIDYVKTLDFVDIENIYLLGSSMGGATVAAAAISHSEDIKGIILQYPAINLNVDAYTADSQWNVNRYAGLVLILQGTKDVITPLPMAQELHDYYNTLFDGHSQLIIYEGQPHVFHGAYKVKAAEEIYRFITETGA